MEILAIAIAAFVLVPLLFAVTQTAARARTHRARQRAHHRRGFVR